MDEELMIALGLCEAESGAVTHRLTTLARGYIIFNHESTRLEGYEPVDCGSYDRTQAGV